MMPASARSHSASNPTSPVVTSPTMVTLSSSASNPPVATRPHAVKAGPPPCVPSPPLERWNALRSRMSSAVMVRASVSRSAFFAHSGRLNGSSAAALGSTPGALVRLIPPTVTCELPPPSRRAVSASTTCVPTVRPKRTIHAFGIGSEFSIVPVAVASSMRAPEALASISVSVSSPSSCASSSTVTSTVFDRSPPANVSVPLAAR